MEDKMKKRYLVEGDESISVSQKFKLKKWAATYENNDIIEERCEEAELQRNITDNETIPHMIGEKYKAKFHDYPTNDDIYSHELAEARFSNDATLEEQCTKDDLDDKENKSPVKKASLAKLQERKKNVSKQINMRSKIDRKKLKGRDCWECKEYYNALKLSEDELQKRKDKCSRHRQKYERPHTPEGFWDPEFPDWDEEFPKISSRDKI